MAEHHQPPGRHLAAGGGAVVLEHVPQGLEQQRQVRLGEAGALAGVVGERGGDEAVGAVQAVGDDVLAAHGAVVAALFGGVVALGPGLLFRLVGGGHAGDRNFQRQHGLDGLCEADLHGAADLPGVDARGEHAAEGADVVEIVAHEAAKAGRLVVGLRRELLVFGGGRVAGAQRDIGFAMLLVQHGAFGDVDAETRRVGAGDLDIVADLALEADVADQPVSRLWVHPRHVAGVRVAVGVAVLDVEEQHELVPALQGVLKH